MVKRQFLRASNRPWTKAPLLEVVIKLLIKYLIGFEGPRGRQYLLGLKKVSLLVTGQYSKIAGIGDPDGDSTGT